MRLLIIACVRRPATVNAAARQDQHGALIAQQPDWPFRRVAKCASGTHHMIGRIMAKSKSRGAKGKKGGGGRLPSWLLPSNRRCASSNGIAHAPRKPWSPQDSNGSSVVPRTRLQDHLPSELPQHGDGGSGSPAERF